MHTFEFLAIHRILVCGPAGSGVAEQVELLSQALCLPRLEFQTVLRKRILELAEEKALEKERKRAVRYLAKMNLPPGEEDSDEEREEGESDFDSDDYSSDEMDDFQRWENVSVSRGAAGAPDDNDDEPAERERRGGKLRWPLEAPRLIPKLKNLRHMAFYFNVSKRAIERLREEAVRSIFPPHMGGAVINGKTVNQSPNL